MHKYSYHLVGLLLLLAIAPLGVAILEAFFLLSYGRSTWYAVWGGIFLFSFGLVRLVSVRQPEGILARDWPLVLVFAVWAGLLCVMLYKEVWNGMSTLRWAVALCGFFYLAFYAGFKAGQKRYYQAIALTLAFATPVITVASASLLCDILKNNLESLRISGVIVGMLGYAFGRFVRLPDDFARRWWPWLFPPLFWLFCGGAFTLYNGILFINIMEVGLWFVVPPYLLYYLGFGLGSLQKKCVGKLRGAGIYLLALALFAVFFTFAAYSTWKNKTEFRIIETVCPR